MKIVDLKCAVLGRNPIVRLTARGMRVAIYADKAMLHLSKEHTAFFD